VRSPDQLPGLDELTASDGRVFASAAARRSALVRLALVVAAGGGGLWALHSVAPALFDPTQVRTRVRAFGPLAPLAFVGLQALQVVLAPIPGQTLAVVGGYLFGPVAGSLYSVLGVTVGSWVVFVASRRLGRPFVERVLADEVLDRFDAFVHDRGVAGLFVVFLLPTFPDDAICALAGLTDLRLRTLVGLVVVGRTPTFVLAAVAGDGLGAARYDLVAGLVVLAAGATLLVYLGRERFGTAWR
jgi:uncharacterized membrane protein YdjX (TVP38/TMEM64 family)